MRWKKRNFTGWRCYIFTADLRLPKLIRLEPSRRTPLWNGALECRLYEFEIVPRSSHARISPVTRGPYAYFGEGRKIRARPCAMANQANFSCFQASSLRMRPSASWSVRSRRSGVIET